MGMAASQARLLSLTARQHDLEMQAQVLQSRKLQLANDSDKVYNQYLNAVNNKKIQYRFTDTTGQSQLRDASMNALENRMAGVTNNTSSQVMFMQSIDGSTLFVTPTINDKFDMKGVNEGKYPVLTDYLKDRFGARFNSPEISSQNEVVTYTGLNGKVHQTRITSGTYVGENYENALVSGGINAIRNIDNSYILNEMGGAVTIGNASDFIKYLAFANEKQYNSETSQYEYTDRAKMLQNANIALTGDIDFNELYDESGNYKTSVLAPIISMLQEGNLCTDTWITEAKYMDTSDWAGSAGHDWYAPDYDYDNGIGDWYDYDNACYHIGGKTYTFVSGEEGYVNLDDPNDNVHYYDNETKTNDQYTAFINDLLSCDSAAAREYIKQDALLNVGHNTYGTTDKYVETQVALIDKYSGVFDGNGHTITGLPMTLFNELNGATVQNIKIADSEIHLDTSCNDYYNNPSDGEFNDDNTYASVHRGALANCVIASNIDRIDIENYTFILEDREGSNRDYSSHHSPIKISLGSLVGIVMGDPSDPEARSQISNIYMTKEAQYNKSGNINSSYGGVEIRFDDSIASKAYDTDFKNIYMLNKFYNNIIVDNNNYSSFLCSDEKFKAYLMEKMNDDANLAFYYNSESEEFEFDIDYTDEDGNNTILGDYVHQYLIDNWNTFPDDYKYLSSLNNTFENVNVSNELDEHVYYFNKTNGKISEDGNVIWTATAESNEYEVTAADGRTYVLHRGDSLDIFVINEDAIEEWDNTMSSLSNDKKVDGYNDVELLEDKPCDQLLLLSMDEIAMGKNMFTRNYYDLITDEDYENDEELSDIDFGSLLEMTLVGQRNLGGGLTEINEIGNVYELPTNMAMAFNMFQFIDRYATRTDATMIDREGKVKTIKNNLDAFYNYIGQSNIYYMHNPKLNPDNGSPIDCSMQSFGMLQDLGFINKLICMGLSTNEEEQNAAKDAVKAENGDSNLSDFANKLCEVFLCNSDEFKNSLFEEKEGSIVPVSDYLSDKILSGSQAYTVNDYGVRYIASANGITTRINEDDKLEVDLFFPPISNSDEPSIDDLSTNSTVYTDLDINTVANNLYLSFVQLSVVNDDVEYMYYADAAIFDSIKNFVADACDYDLTKYPDEAQSNDVYSKMALLNNINYVFDTHLENNRKGMDDMLSIYNAYQYYYDPVQNPEHKNELSNILVNESISDDAPSEIKKLQNSYNNYKSSYDYKAPESDNTFDPTKFEDFTDGNIVKKTYETINMENPEVQKYVSMYNIAQQYKNIQVLTEAQSNSNDYVTNMIANAAGVLMTIDMSKLKGMVSSVEYTYLAGSTLDTEEIRNEKDQSYKNAAKPFLDVVSHKDVNFSTSIYLEEVANTAEQSYAQAIYESSMAKIHRKEKRVDTELAEIESERTAIKNEQDTLKTVAKENIELTFKLFS